MLMTVYEEEAELDWEDISAEEVDMKMVSLSDLDDVFQAIKSYMVNAESQQWCDDAVPS